MDRDGRRKAISESQRAYRYPLFSPDGRRIAVDVEGDARSFRAMVVDIASDAWTRVGGDVDSHYPQAWMPDSQRLLLVLAPSSHGLAIAPLDGSASPETLDVGEAQGVSVVPDGSAVLFSRQRVAVQWDIWRLPLTDTGEAEPRLATPSEEWGPSVSPDGRWVAYQSNDSGRPEIYVRAYSGSGGRHHVSTQGGVSPRWSRDGSGIIFQEPGPVDGRRPHLADLCRRPAPEALRPVRRDLRFVGRIARRPALRDGGTGPLRAAPSRPRRRSGLGRRDGSAPRGDEVTTGRGRGFGHARSGPGERFGVSRKTGYKWVARYESDGVAGLEEHSRAPLSHPHAVTDDVVEKILAIRKKHPRWGPRKLRVLLERHYPQLALPVASTIGEVCAGTGSIGNESGCAGAHRTAIVWGNTTLRMRCGVPTSRDIFPLPTGVATR